MFEKVNYENNQLYFDGVNLGDIAKKYKTPVYIYSKDKIIKNFNNYVNNFKKENIKDFLICFAIKANDNLTILKSLSKLDCGADTVSAKEIEKSLLAGIPADKIIYSGVGKSDEEIEYAIKQKIYQFNVESLEEFKNIQKIAKKLGIIANISIRINPNIDAGTHEKITTGKKENKFGVSINITENILKFAKDDKFINVRGLSIHIGSQILDVNKFDLTFKFVSDIYKNHPEFKTLDLGGGLGIQYREDEKPPLYNEYARLVAKYFGNLNVKIIVEPGRSIVGDAGVFLTKVMYVKETETKKFIVVDGGMNNLVRPAMYGAYHHPMPVNIRTDEKDTYDIVGPICESGDVFVKDIKFMKIEKDNYVIFLSAGAYGRSMSSNYNLHDMAGELLIDDGEVKTIRKPISFKDLLRFEE